MVSGALFQPGQALEQIVDEARDAIVAQSLGKPGAITKILEWTPERSLEVMDKNGIATAIGSVSAPGIWFGNLQATRNLARACNEYGADLVKRYLGRYRRVGPITLTHPQFGRITCSDSLR